MDSQAATWPQLAARAACKRRKKMGAKSPGFSRIWRGDGGAILRALQAPTRSAALVRTANGCVDDSFARKNKSRFGRAGALD
jgi:hypothetical protein